MSGFSLGTPVVLGIPFDAHSSYMRGAAGAPAAIRMALHSSSGNSWTESGVDLGVEGGVRMRATCGLWRMHLLLSKPVLAN
jgi:arginase family enzyme